MRHYNTALLRQCGISECRVAVLRHYRIPSLSSCGGVPAMECAVVSEAGSFVVSVLTKSVSYSRFIRYWLTRYRFVGQTGDGC
jgi:hypothetical protein